MGPAKKAKTKRQTQTTAIPKQSMTCTKTIRKPNSSNFHKHRKIQTSKTGQQRKAWIHTIIHKPQQVWRKKKKKGHDLHENNHKTQTVQIFLSPQQVLD